MTGPEKSSSECEMQVCTILSKVNSVFWQVSEADLDGEDEKIIKIQKNPLPDLQYLIKLH